MANPYDVLGVPRDADDEAIKNAYRELVKEYHPDHGGDREKFNQIREAYEQIKSGDVGRQENTNSQQQVTCSNCGKTRNTSDKDFKYIGKWAYCGDCYVETPCKHCGKSITTTPEQYRENNGELYCSDCIIETHCASCGKSLSVTPNKYEIEEDLYCSDCLVQTQCVECGTELNIPESQHIQLNQNPVCKVCEDNIALNQNQRKGTRRRKILAVLGFLGAVRVGQFAIEEGYLSGIISGPEPDFEEEEKLSLNNEYYAERFYAPEGGRLEYELTVVSGGMESHLYTATEYQKFKQGVEEESRYDRGEDIDKCSVGAGGGDRELSCELPKESKYALVILPFVNEAQGVLNYRVYS